MIPLHLYSSLFYMDHYLIEKIVYEGHCKSALYMNHNLGTLTKLLSLQEIQVFLCIFF